MRTGFLFLLCCLLCSCTGVEMRRHSSKPNIILIMADDVGIEAFGCYGGESYSTPVIDGLAKSGVRFANCHSQPLCTPSRVKLMTGKSNARNYKYFSILDPEEATFGSMMKEAGYATAVAGKWQLYGTEKYGDRMATGTHPNHAGFDEYCLWQVQSLGSRYMDPTIVKNGRLMEEVKGKYGPDLFCEFILDFMERKKGKPFFIYYPMALVHNPFEPTPNSADRGSRIKAQNFADMMAYMDRTVGRIVDGLDDLGLRENTLVIFTSDNGTNTSITSTWKGKKVKGGKGRTTDAGTHVPLVVSWPTRTPKGAVCDDLVDFSDFMPTLAEASGAKRPDDLDGMSFLKQVRGRKGKAREWIFCYYHPRPSRDDTEAVWFARDKRYKLYHDGRLIDLEKDPDEKDPLPDDAGAEIRAKLQGVIDSQEKSKGMQKAKSM